MSADILSTHYLPQRPSWAARVAMLDRRRHSPVKLLARLVRTAARYDAVVVNGAAGASGYYVDLIAAGVIGRLRGGPVVVLTGCHWKAGTSTLIRRLRRAAIRAVDGPSVTYCVLARDEKQLLSDLWSLPTQRMALTPYQYNLTEDELVGAVSDEGGVFAGGDSMRDYGPLVEAARHVDAPFVLATDRFSRRRSPLPANVTDGRVPHARFIELLRAATVVVVPMLPDMERTAGQQTFLNAMALAKPVIVTDSPGVRDYLTDGGTAFLVPPGDAGAMAERLRWVLDPANREAVKAVRERGREAALMRFGPEQHAATLLRVVDEAISSRRRPEDRSPLRAT
jgi:hypothetical protein